MMVAQQTIAAFLRSSIVGFEGFRRIVSNLFDKLKAKFQPGNF
jgi:hypothetical protein